MNNRRMITAVLTFSIVVSATFFSFKVINAFTAKGNIFLKTKILTDIMFRVQNEYVDEVDIDRVFNKAVNAIMEELDPHSQYVPPKNYEDMSERFLGYQGIGISFRMIEGKITVMRVLRDGPSERAGLQIGDRIVEIKGNSAVGLEQDDVPPLLKGQAGTAVDIGIEREGVEGILPVRIMRGKAFEESIKYFYMLDDKTGYINLEKFSQTSRSELDWTIQQLEAQGMENLVFDLRFNGGGLLPQAKEITDKFLDGGKVIVKTRGRIPAADNDFMSEDEPDDFEKPVVVLVNEGSASASEIVSGALQDWDRGYLVGKTTFGKGLMQAQIPYEDQSALLLTTGRWYTPLGRLIQKNYEGKTAEEYRRDAVNDSLNQARMLDEDRPAFKTPAGRTVYGGGGIAPDVQLESTNLVSRFAINMSNADPKQPIFRYAQKYSVRNPGNFSNVNDLVENYALNDAEYRSFIDFLNSIEFEYKEEEIQEYKDDIERYLEANIAQFYWGDEGYWRVLMYDDNVLEEAMKHIEDAKALRKN